MEDPLRLDWDAVELDYRAGLLTDGLICAKHGVSLTALRRMVAAKNWVRQPLEIPSPPPLGGMEPPSGIVDGDVVRKAQLLQIAQVVRMHRRDIDKLRAGANLLFDRLMLILQGAEVQLPCIGSRESPADMLRKLTVVMGAAIQLEREVLGLSSHVGTPEDGVDNSADWKEVQKTLDAIHENKVVDVHAITEVKSKK